MTSKNRIAAIILAAGAASRMGRPKQLLAINGKSMIRHAVETAIQAGYDDIILVTGAYADEIKVEIENDAKVDVVQNERWQEGIGTSIQAGIKKILADKSQVYAATIMLCDQPLITPELLKRLVEVQKSTGKRIVACSYGKTIGVPALFYHSFFMRLAELEGDHGAKKIIRQYTGESASVPFDHASIDLDTMSDYHDFINRYLC